MSVYFDACANSVYQAFPPTAERNEATHIAFIMYILLHTYVLLMCVYMYLSLSAPSDIDVAEILSRFEGVFSGE